MSGGGKGGSQSTSVEIPAWLEDPSKRAIERGEAIGQIGYQPWMGPDVAGLSSGQRTAMQNTNAAADAYGMKGMDVPSGRDLGSFSTFEDAVRRGRKANPTQADQYDAMFTSSSSGKGGGGY